MSGEKTQAVIDYDGQWHREGFLEHLEWERDLAAATLVAYRREVTAVIEFLVVELCLGKPTQVDTGALRSYLAHLHGRRLSARSIARALASTRLPHTWPRLLHPPLPPAASLAWPRCCCPWPPCCLRARA